MDNYNIRQFDEVFKRLDNGTLGQAIRFVRKIADANQQLMSDEELVNIENDYKLMLGYMKQGFNDPQRGDIYAKLAARLRRYTSDLLTAYKTRNVPFFSETLRKAGTRQMPDNDGIKAELEGFVTDAAMLSLEVEPERTEKSKALYRKHNDFMQALFCHIVVSKQWNEHDATIFKELLLSPTTDTNDAQLIVSALTLATMNNPDANKFDILLHTYLHTGDEKVRQRALIGWVFALSAEREYAKSIKLIAGNALDDKDVASELADLQKQIIFCVNTDQDADTIRRDIMPELIKNNNLNITRFGITEKEEDAMADILDPGASDRAMEKMEESFQKMMNMQKAGSDIYFGGFSQMKRFAFFYNVANWFCPFYIEHPEISSCVENLKNTPLLVNILNNGPFCDSDKYSFTLAVSAIIGKLPDNMKEMFNSAEALGPTMSDEDMHKPAYIRRMILQDMYRFFRLFPQRAQLVNPFDNKHFMFISNKLFAGTNVRDYVPELCYFMIKHKNKEALEQLLKNYDDPQDAKLLFAHGIYELDFAKRPDKAVEYLDKLICSAPDNKRAMSLLARANFEYGRYERSAECYGTLYSQDPANKTVAINYCVALSKSARYDEAVNLLYKLDIEYPDSMPVIRVLAWTLMGLGKYAQAEKSYNRLLNSTEYESGDQLNAGYCRWLSGDTAGAVTLFKEFVKARSTDGKPYDISKEFANDGEFLTAHGVSDTDMRLMTDLTAMQ